MFLFGALESPTERGGEGRTAVVVITVGMKEGVLGRARRERKTAETSSNRTETQNKP